MADDFRSDAPGSEQAASADPRTSGTQDAAGTGQLHGRAELVAALKAAQGYMMNALIDLQTDTPKRTTIATLRGGVRLLETALAKAES